MKLPQLAFILPVMAPLRRDVPPPRIRGAGLEKAAVGVLSPLAPTAPIFVYVLALKRRARAPARLAKVSLISDEGVIWLWKPP